MNEVETVEEDEEEGNVEAEMVEELESRLLLDQINVF